MKTFFRIALLLYLCLGLSTEGTAQNLLHNPYFDDPNPAGTTSSFTRTTRQRGGGQSGADRWTTWVNAIPGTIETEWMPSNFTGGHMLRVSTDSHHSGIVQVFDRANEGPEEAMACFWVLVERGGVTVSLTNRGNGGGYPITLRANPQWQRVSIRNSTRPANQICIYSDGKEGAEFFVESATVYPGPPQEVECCQPR